MVGGVRRLRRWLRERRLDRAEYIMFIRGHGDDQWNKAWYELVIARRGVRHLYAEATAKETPE